MIAYKRKCKKEKNENNNTINIKAKRTTQQIFEKSCVLIYESMVPFQLSVFLSFLMIKCKKKKKKKKKEKEFHDKIKKKKKDEESYIIVVTCT